MKQFFRLFAYAKPYLPKLILGFFLVVLVGQSPLFMPLVQKFVIDDLLMPANKPIASVNLMFRDDLDNQAVLSNRLRQEFEAQGISLSPSTVVSIEKQGEKWKLNDTETDQKYRINQKVFRLGSDFQKKQYLEKLEGVTDLAELKGMPTPLREEFDTASKKLHKAFKDRDILLSLKAIVSVEEAGSRWLVIDRANEKQHTIWKENGKLYVADGEIKVYTATLAYTVLGREFHYTLVDWLIVILFVIIIYYAIFGVLSYFCTYVMTWVSQRILFDLRNKVFSHLQSLSMHFYEAQGTGQIPLTGQGGCRFAAESPHRNNDSDRNRCGNFHPHAWHHALLELEVDPLLLADLPANHRELSHLPPTGCVQCGVNGETSGRILQQGCTRRSRGQRSSRLFIGNVTMSDSYSIICVKPLNRESKSWQPKQRWGVLHSSSSQSAGLQSSVTGGI